MAGFRTHVAVSSLLGAGYAAALIKAGTEWTHAGLAAGLCAVSGMLPDLDSASGRPAHELFGLVAAVVPLLLMHRLRKAELTAEGIILVLGGLYLLIRFGASWLFRHLTVHRGMFHSLPAALIAAEIVFLAHDGEQQYGQFILAGGVLIGFLSHLVLDELYSVDAQGLRIRLNKSAGSAFKLFSGNIPATVMTWLLLAGLSYMVGIKQGYIQPIHFAFSYPPSLNAWR